jgi:hypothetical protein
MRDLTDTTTRMSPRGYPELNGPKLAELIRQFKDAGLDTRPARPGETAGIAKEVGVKWPAQAWSHLGQWRKGAYDDLPQPQPAKATHNADVGIKLTTDELRRINDLLGEIAAVATMLQRRLQQ